MKKKQPKAHSHQSLLTMKIVVAILCAFVVLYMGLNFYESLKDPVSTVGAVYGSAEDLIPLNGWFLRDEQLLPEQSGVVEVVAAEGGRVGVGQVIAEVYDNQKAVEQKHTLEKLDNQISQLEDAMQTSSDITSTQKMEESLLDSILQLSASVADQNFINLESQISDLRSLIFKWDYAFEDKQAAQTALEDLKAQRAALSAMGTGSSHELRVQESGTYSSMVDGFESELTIDMMEHVTVGSFEHWPELQHDMEAGEYIGKLVKGFAWYYVAVMDYDTARRYSRGQQVTLRLSSSTMETFSVEVYRIGENEDGRCVIIFRSDSFLADTVALRRENADIITQTYEGIKIPKEAVRMDEQGQLGLYCRMGIQARFRKVKIIYEADTYYLSEYMPTDTEYVRAGDEVLISSREMYDGKIVG